MTTHRIVRVLLLFFTSLVTPSLARAEEPATQGDHAPAPVEENLLATEPSEAEDPFAQSAERRQGVETGATGSFGSRLEELAVGFEPFLHAYATIDLVGKPETATGATNPKAWSFDPHYFNLFIGATLGPVQPELQLEVEHGDEVVARIAQVDFTVHPAFVVRTGIFLVPFGVYNEYLYPEYVRPLPRQPLTLVLDRLVPVAWNETGVQIRGRGPLSDDGDWQWTYAAFVGNGLQLSSPTADPTNVRSMRGNFRGDYDGKSVGGRIGLAYGNLTFGSSGYFGPYAADYDQKIKMVGVDLNFQREDAGLLVEYAWQEIDLPTGGVFNRDGVSVQGYFSLLSWLRPALLVDILREDGPDILRVGPVLAFYPAVKASPHTSVRLAYGHNFALAGELATPDQTFLLQATTAF